MSSFKPIVIVYGSTTRIAEIDLQLPVSFRFAFDVATLENIVNSKIDLTEAILYRYFIVLLDSIDEDVQSCLTSNHRVIGVYDHFIRTTNQRESSQMNNSPRQLMLDISSDIISFLTIEGEKQKQLERVSTTMVYYKQARSIKEWAMASCRAEPCHILLIPLNSSQKNLDDTQSKLQAICSELGFSSTIIRQLSDYIPHHTRQSSLLPYAKPFFTYEDPNCACKIIKGLCPIRLYLYGNEDYIVSEWSNLMIGTETRIMDDEDNWCGFLENDPIDNDIKWNFAFIFGRQLPFTKISPIQLTQLNDNPRFDSALRRAYTTLPERQMQATERIFDWYEDCIKTGALKQEPKLSPNEEVSKRKNREKLIEKLEHNCAFRNKSTFDYTLLNSLQIKSLSFIWLDKIVYDCERELQEIIQPFKWTFFDSIPSCIPFIERQLREQCYVFLVVSGTLGEQLYVSMGLFLRQLFGIYVFCAHLGPNLEWSRKNGQIRGVYNDSRELADQIRNDYIRIQNSLNAGKTRRSIIQNNINQDNIVQGIETPLPLPIIVYDAHDPHSFMAHQRTIDALLCMPHTDESSLEMFEEFRRIFSDNDTVLPLINHFTVNYYSCKAVQWYTRDSFVWRVINQALCSSDADTMFKLRYILTDMYNHLSISHYSNRSRNWNQPLSIFYRGQLVSTEEFESLKELRGRIISIKTFLSTTVSMQVALMYAGHCNEIPGLVSVVFSIEVDGSMLTRPYADISEYSLFRDEDEILFAMGSVFRVNNIRLMPNEDKIWLVHLKAIDSDPVQFR